MSATPRGRTVLVVDDHEMVLMGLQALLLRQGWVGRCLVARNRQEALDLARGHDIHIAVVDLFIGEQMGMAVARELREEQAWMKIILTSGTGSVAPAVARAAGVDGFVPKYWPAAAMVEAIHRVAEGATVLPRRDDAEPLRKLSKREEDVLKHIAEGLSNPEMAAVLHLSRHTVKQHTTAVYRKLGARNRAEAASMAREFGLV